MGGGGPLRFMSSSPTRKNATRHPRSPTPAPLVWAPEIQDRPLRRDLEEESGLKGGIYQHTHQKGNMSKYSIPGNSAGDLFGDGENVTPSKLK